MRFTIDWSTNVIPDTPLSGRKNVSASVMVFGNQSRMSTAFEKVKWKLPMNTHRFDSIVVQMKFARWINKSPMVNIRRNNRSTILINRFGSSAILVSNSIVCHRFKRVWKMALGHRSKRRSAWVSCSTLLIGQRPRDLKNLLVANLRRFRMPFSPIPHRPMPNMPVSNDIYWRIMSRESNVCMADGKVFDHNVSKRCVLIRIISASMVTFSILARYSFRAKEPVWPATVVRDTTWFRKWIIFYVITMDNGNQPCLDATVQFPLGISLKNEFVLAKCRLPDLGKQLIGYYMDDNTNEWYGKELQPGAYIRHGYSIKYQCQCPAKYSLNCSFIQPIATQCVDGQWTHNGPQCREGQWTRWSMSPHRWMSS